MNKVHVLLQLSKYQNELFTTKHRCMNEKWGPVISVAVEVAIRSLTICKYFQISLLRKVQGSKNPVIWKFSGPPQ
jgi:hypothetical protein